MEFVISVPDDEIDAWVKRSCGDEILVCATIKCGNMTYSTKIERFPIPLKERRTDE